MFIYLRGTQKNNLPFKIIDRCISRQEFRTWLLVSSTDTKRASSSWLYCMKTAVSLSLVYLLDKQVFQELQEKEGNL